MARVLIIHSDRPTRKFLEKCASQHHEVSAVSDLAKGFHAISKQRPSLILAGLSVQKKEALELLRSMERAGTKIPTIVVAASEAGAMQPAVMKHGAAAYMEYPLEAAALDQAISKALQTDVEARGKLPPISQEEAEANLSELETGLNLRMQCFAGKNQVYIQSIIIGQMRTTKPRISLKCPLRAEYGHPPNVYYEYIRDICCGDPSVCPAYQTFKARHAT